MKYVHRTNHRLAFCRRSHVAETKNRKFFFFVSEFLQVSDSAEKEFDLPTSDPDLTFREKKRKCLAGIRWDNWWNDVGDPARVVDRWTSVSKVVGSDLGINSVKVFLCQYSIWTWAMCNIGIYPDCLRVANTPELKYVWFTWVSS